MSNQAMSNGGGACCYECPGIQFISCVFDSNSAGTGGGLDLVLGDLVEISDCGFTANYASIGGAISCGAGAPTFTACRVTDNESLHGGAGMCCNSADPLLIGCTFEANAGEAGGAIGCYESSAPTLEQCTLIGNSAAYGSGLYCGYASAPVLTRTIITQGGEGQAIHGSPEAITLECCDIYDNAGGDWVDAIADQLGENGNISLDPMFCDAGSDEYTIHAQSPCAPGSYPNPECDLIGAWPVDCGQQSAGEEPRAVGGMTVNWQPNPFCASTRLACATGTLDGGLQVRVTVHDQTGRLVKRLGRSPGSPLGGVIEWDGTDERGRRLPTGAYVLRLTAGEEVRTRTVLLVR